MDLKASKEEHVRGMEGKKAKREKNLSLSCYTITHIKETIFHSCQLFLSVAILRNTLYQGTQWPNLGWEPGGQSLYSFLSAIKLYPDKSTALQHPIYRDYILLSYRQSWDTPPNLGLDPAISFLCLLIAPSSTLSPFLHVNTQYLQILSTQDHQEPYLSGSQESSHSSKTQRVQQ